MDRIFVEQVDDDKYRIAVIDRDRIFRAEDPGKLATVYECSASLPSREDDAQIFYALESLIGALDIFVDLKNKHRSSKLNTWSIAVTDKNIDNIFLTVKVLSTEDRIKLYSKQYSITPSETITSNSNSLMSLISFAEKLEWKTGILQRCFDRLVYHSYRKNLEMYAYLDEYYRKVMRFKYETEYIGIPDIKDGILVEIIRKITSILGIQNTRDNTLFKITDDVNKYIELLRKNIELPNGNTKNIISYILDMWCGSKLIENNDTYRIEPDNNITKVLLYMQSLLTRPKILEILETPM